MEQLKECLTCTSCQSKEVILITHEIHGFGVRCAKCNSFLRWTGKAKEKGQKNHKHRKEHKKNGELICEWCGITESEAKEMGMHFQIDHRLAEDFGGEDTFENTRALCSGCHYEKTAKEHTTRGIRKLFQKLSSEKEMLEAYLNGIHQKDQSKEAPF